MSALGMGGVHKKYEAFRAASAEFAERHRAAITIAETFLVVGGTILTTAACVHVVMDQGVNALVDLGVPLAKATSTVNGIGALAAGGAILTVGLKRPRQKLCALHSRYTFGNGKN